MSYRLPLEDTVGAAFPTRADRWMQPLYWLAGARLETLRHCPPAERERVAVLGSTVLIPTVMSFLGMLFYAKSRFADPPWFAVAGIALAWSFVIMMTDRILLATYRPYLPFWRRAGQVVFRILLAGVVSLAIAFPFCLDQYRPAITYRLQTELQGKLNTWRAEEATARATLAAELAKIREDEETKRKQLNTEFTAQQRALAAQLPDLENVIVNPEAYAETRMDEERRKASAPEFVAPASGATRTLLADIDAQKETLAKTQSEFEGKQALHRRLVEAMARESAGLPNEFYPEPKKAGEGPRTKDLRQRDLATTQELKRLVAQVSAQRAALVASDRDLAAARLADRNTFLDGLNTRRQSFIEEAQDKEKTRRQKLEKVRADLATLEADHPRRLARLAEQTAALETAQASDLQRHDERYLPYIRRLEQKMHGVLDPMEETLGLYRVIFLPAPDITEGEKTEQSQKWIAGVFQFLVIFGTLFVLDLVPIMTKIFSRPGPYDALVEHSEYVTQENMRMFHERYPEHALDWSLHGLAANPAATQLVREHPRDWDALDPDDHPEPPEEIPRRMY